MAASLANIQETESIFMSQISQDEFSINDKEGQMQRVQSENTTSQIITQDLSKSINSAL